MLGVGDVHAVEEVRVADRACAAPGGIADEDGRVLFAFGHDAFDRQIVFAREVEVALVVRGNAEHRTGAIFHQHEIGDVDRQLPIRLKRVLCGQAGIEAELFRRLQLGRGGAALFAPRDEVGGLGRAPGQRLRDRVVGRDRDEAGAEDRVGASGEDLNLAAIGYGEAEAQTLALADPVFLHQPDLVGPVLQLAETRQQLVGEGGDFQKPLAELALLDERARAPAAPVDDLLVGEHGHVDRVPIDRALLTINEAGLEEIEEQRLFMAVVIGLAGRQLARPVERKPDALELRLHVGDVGAGPGAGVHPLFHRGVLGGHAKRVPAHRVQHLMPRHPTIAREDVAHRIVANVAHVDVSAGIGKHFKHIDPRLGRAIVGGEGLPRVPDALPMGVRLERIEARRLGHGFTP